MNAAEQIYDVLNTSGWCQGFTRKSTGEHCIMGAVGVLENSLLQLLAGTSPSPVYEEFVASCASVIHEQYPDRIGNSSVIPAVSAIVLFNDHPDTTFDDVRVVLEKVAAHG
jgi:hypothetical protein